MLKKNFVGVIAVSLILFLSVIAVAQEKVEITVASDTVGKSYELALEAAEMYEKDHPNVDVKILDTPRLANDRLNLYLQYFEAKSSKVDVYQIDVIWPGDLAEHFVDLYQYGAEQVIDQHFPALVKNNTVDGRLIAIPFQLGSGLLYYRTDLLEKYNLEVPQTWDELEKAAEIIMKGERADNNKDFWGFVFQGDNYEGLTCNALEWVYSNDGGTIISKDKNITINNPNTIEMIEKAAGWVGTIAPVGVTSMAEEDARNIWQSGNAAFMRNWPYAYSLSIGDASAVKGKFGISPLPAGKGGTRAATAGGWHMGVSKYSKNLEIAADVAFFMASYEVQKLRAVKGSFNPTIKSLYEDEDVLAANPFFESLYDVFVTAIPRPSTATAPNYTEVSKYFSEAVHSVLTGKEDAQTAIRYLEYDLMDVTGFETGQPQKY